MIRQLAALALAANLCASCEARADARSQGMLYLELPLATSYSRETAPTFGVRLYAPAGRGIDHRAGQPVPAMDLQFGRRQPAQMFLLGQRIGNLPAHKAAEPTQEASAPVNWWLVVPAVALGVIVIQHAGPKQRYPQVVIN